MILPSFLPASKPLLDRYSSDLGTKLRLKYQPYYHAVEARDGVHVMVKGRRLLMMSSNEYLGLSTHPRVVRAACAAVEKWGTSPCGSRLANGSRSLHEALEEQLADFLGVEACHVLSAG